MATVLTTQIIALAVLFIGPVVALISLITRRWDVMGIGGGATVIALYVLIGLNGIDE